MRAQAAAPALLPSGTRTRRQQESMSSPRFGQGSSFSVSSSLYSTGGRGGRSSSLLSTWKSLRALGLGRCRGGGAVRRDQADGGDHASGEAERETTSGVEQ